MSFFVLLVLLSLIIIVPVFFVIKEKSKQAQINTTHCHQQYLASAHQPTAVTEVNSSNQNSHSLAIIDFSSNHAFIQQLYNSQVPQAFRAIMDDIGQQYERTHHDQLTESQLFTFNKLIETRVPELVSDYLSLDPNYAETVIIDKENNTTSYTIVLAQLQSILDFAQKLNTQSQSGVVDKLLASRRYLDDVAQDNGIGSSINNDMLNLK